MEMETDCEKTDNCGFYETKGVANTAHIIAVQNANQVKFKVTADNALGAASHTARYVFDASTLEIPNDVTSGSSIQGAWTTNDRTSNGIKVVGGANVMFNGLV